MNNRSGLNSYNTLLLLISDCRCGMVSLGQYISLQFLKSWTKLVEFCTGLVLWIMIEETWGAKMQDNVKRMETLQGWFVWMLGVKIIEQMNCSRLVLRPVLCAECPDPSGEPYEGEEGDWAKGGLLQGCISSSWQPLLAVFVTMPVTNLPEILEVPMQQRCPPVWVTQS